MCLPAPSDAPSVAREFLLVEAGMTVAYAVDPAATPEPVACRIAAMLEIRLSFGRASCKAAASPDKTQAFGPDFSKA
ncbi:hypothetical protein AS890_12615 [Rhizobium anhuiense bv. trifolii]|nr:hypothetical protein AS890_12615 [Rhizobium anhuiense bv. trifolii]